MKTHRIVNAIGHIDDDLINSATKSKKVAKKNIWIKWTSLAASFAVIIIVAAVAVPTLFGDGNTTLPILSGDNTTINNSEITGPATNDKTTSPTVNQDSTTHINNAEPTTSGGKDNTTLQPPNENITQPATTIWLSADEAIKSAENDPQYMGVSVPLLIAYQGTIYGCPTEEYNENSKYALLENEVILRKNYSYPAYQVKDISDNVAIVLNGRLETYQKLFEIKVVVNGNTYRIVQPMMSGIDYSCGEIIQENEDFTVYQAINAQNGEVVESEYVINILPLLKRELPNFFNGDENYGDAWWVAVPQ